MPKFGWYYEGDNVCGSGGDYWEVIERALEDATEFGDRDTRLRVGEMRMSRPSDFFHESDVDWGMKDGFDVADVIDLLSERYGEAVEESNALLVDADRAESSFAVLWEQRREAGFAKRVLAWADENICFDPEEWCDGAPVGDIVWIAGEWRCQGELSDADRANVKGTVDLDPRGGVWRWRALHASGAASTLKTAMANAGEVFRGWEPSDGEAMCDDRDGPGRLRALHVKSGWAKFRSMEAIQFELDREDVDGPCVSCGAADIETVDAGSGRWCLACVTARDASGGEDT